MNKRYGCGLFGPILLVTALLSGCSLDVKSWPVHLTWPIVLMALAFWLLRAGYELLLLEWFSRKSPSVRRDVLKLLPKLTCRSGSHPQP